MNFNRCIIGGRLTRDPEVRYTPTGKAVANFCLACSRKWTTEAGEEKEDTLFIDVTAWGKQAELVGQYLRKGAALLVEGRLKQEKWDDRETGKPRSKIVLWQEQMQFAGSKRSEEGDSAPAPAREGAATGRRTTAATAPAADGPPGEVDDVPF